MLDGTIGSEIYYHLSFYPMRSVADGVLLLKTVNDLTHGDSEDGLARFIEADRGAFSNEFI